MLTPFAESLPRSGKAGGTANRAVRSTYRTTMLTVPALQTFPTVRTVQTLPAFPTVQAPRAYFVSPQTPSASALTRAACGAA